ncbi:hypothetical protein FRC20_007443 [Serendipita sp. 405]|nr:hypothetical protein FRC20_007443 [Serendipita sp. 405]
MDDARMPQDTTFYITHITSLLHSSSHHSVLRLISKRAPQVLRLPFPLSKKKLAIFPLVLPAPSDFRAYFSLRRPGFSIGGIPSPTLPLPKGARNALRPLRNGHTDVDCCSEKLYLHTGHPRVVLVARRKGKGGGSIDRFRQDKRVIVCGPYVCP